jgi:hypothetical protein
MKLIATFTAALATALLIVSNAGLRGGSTAFAACG